jgi:hypothetical protein
VDLIDMIQKAIASGPELHENRDFAVIILTGGSSSWPFMIPMVSELFGVTTDSILVSAAPERTIGEGLAIYNVMRHRHQNAKHAIKDDVSNLKERILQSVNTETAAVAQSLASDITQQVMEIARTYYHGWRNKGGSLSTVEQLVTAACDKIPIKAMVQDRLSGLEGELRDVAIKTTFNWLERHGVKNTALESDVIASKPIGNFVVKIEFDVGKVVGEQIANLLSAISALIVATISGGSGMALIAGGPAGLLIGAIIGGAAVYAGKEAISKKVSEYYFDGVALSTLQMLFSTEKLNNVLRESEQNLASALSEKMISEVENYRPQFERYADMAAEDALSHIDILDRFS